MKFWDPKIETMKKKEMQALQFKRLKKSVKTVYRNVPFYRRKFDEAGVKPDDIRSLADASKLPHTLRTDFTDNYPFGLFSAPMEDIIRIHSSSGTTGKPKVVGYTKQDIETWGNLLARNFTMIGLSKKDIFQNSVNYGLFTGGLGIHNGIETLGATAIPAGTGNTLRQLEMMIDFEIGRASCRERV